MSVTEVLDRGAAVRFSMVGGAEVGAGWLGVPPEVMFAETELDLAEASL